ncbi:MAG: CRISPR-associated helicase Cas3' [Ruminococcus sp.]|nr:CRISPR-associated helicase Cas3' [Ruminococcus sp.]
MAEYISHIRESDKKEQTVSEHSNNVAKIASEFGQAVQMSHTAWLQGILHDAGKLCNDFTEYIRGKSDAKRGEIDHSYMGAKYLANLAIEMYKESRLNPDAALLIGRTILSHHGLHDWLTEDGENYFEKRTSIIKQDKEVECALPEIVSDGTLKKYYQESVKEYDAMQQKMEQLYKEMIAKGEKEKRELSGDAKCVIPAFYQGFLERLMQSILMDADQTDAANFNDDIVYTSPKEPTGVWNNMEKQMQKKCTAFRKKTDLISRRRMNISDRCAAFANHDVKICRLVVPTGGGKTLSALRFAIEYSQKHNVNQIFYIAPFNSILEQNSDVIREIAGEENFLEHHSNVFSRLEENENETERLSTYQMRTERWDVPVIATTLVQFLNALFDGKSSSVRRMHHLCRAVIIIDEVQAIPAKCIHLFNLAMNFLTHICGSTVVLCSATQPCLEQAAYPILLDKQESMTADFQADFDAFRRTVLHSAGEKSFSYEEAAKFCTQQYQENGNLLLVVNTKQAALTMFQKLKERNGASATVLHLSTNMCPVHRRTVIQQMREQLSAHQPLICVTTQLIEAGVDISFRCVVRSMSGLDHAAQAAGRCNRNGEYDCCSVYLIQLEEEKLAAALKQIEKEQEITKKILFFHEKEDLLHPQIMQNYFEGYLTTFQNQFSYPLPDSDHETLLRLLSTNSNNAKQAEAKMHGSVPLRLKNHMQAFRTAGKKFQVIAEQTTDILVPYGAGEKLILDLNGELYGNAFPKLLRKAQQYLVSVYSGTLKALEAKDALIQLESGVLALKSGYYSLEKGVCADGMISMEECFL